MATVRINYCGMEGKGHNVTAATQDAARKLTAVMEGSYTPTILVHRGWAIIVYREPRGFCERIIARPDDGVVAGPVYGSHNYTTQKSAIDAVKRHLAQLGWGHGDDDTPPEFLTDRAAIAEFRSWVRFQIRYKAAKDAGFNDNDCHAYGCNAGFHAELIARIDAAIATQKQQLASLGTIVASD